MALLRVLLLRGSLLLQTEQPHPMAGTPTLVPVPRRIISPGNSMLWRVKVTAVGNGSRERSAAVKAATMRRKGNCEGYPPSLASSQLLCFRNSIAVFGVNLKAFGNQRSCPATSYPHGVRPRGHYNVDVIVGLRAAERLVLALWPASHMAWLPPPTVRKHLPARPLRLPLTLSCDQLETLLTHFAWPTLPLGRDHLPRWLYAAE